MEVLTTSTRKNQWFHTQRDEGGEGGETILTAYDAPVRFEEEPHHELPRASRCEEQSSLHRFTECEIGH
jgi:hypothetical protein